MKLSLLGSRVLVKPAPPITEQNGLYLPDSYAPDVIGTIEVCGATREVGVGDIVIFPPSAGRLVEMLDGRTYLVIDEDELIAVVE